jgi:hypothetical protein
VALLNADGSPDDGASNGYITDALIDADIGLQFAEGDSFELKNGCGSVCATFEDCDKLKGAEVTLNLCKLDAELMSLLVDASTLFTQGGDAIGWEAPPLSAPCPNGVSLELWALAWDLDQQALPPYLGGATPGYYRFFFPRMRFRPGDWTLENEFGVTPVVGKAYPNSAMFDSGPFGDFPTGVTAGGGIHNLYGWMIDDAPPDAQCGFIEVPAGS